MAFAAPPMYPLPPADLSASQTGSVIFLVVCSILMTVAVGWVLDLARRGEILPVLFLLAGLLMGTLEPYLDYLGLLWFADDNVAIAVNLFGRHIPLFVVLGYSFFFGLQAYVMYRAILLGKNWKFFAYAYAVSWLLDFALQATGRALGLYAYYGRQPFMIAGTPAWWFSIDALMPILTGLVLFSIRDRLKGWGSLLVFPILPGMYAALNGAAGFPVFTAINSNFDAGVNGNPTTALVWLGGFITLALVAVYLWLAITQIGRVQRRAGIAVDADARMLDVFTSKVGIGVAPTAERKHVGSH